MFGFLQRRTYRTLNKITVSQSALQVNYAALQASHKEARICPVIKSNAYGHGLRETAGIFDALDAPFLAVDSLFEAYELYKEKVKTPILIMGYTDPENFKVKRLPFHIAVFDLEVAKILNRYQPGCNIHIFVDTGINREGITLTDLPAFLVEIKKLKNLHVVGLLSHFADADNDTSDVFVKKQIDQYKKALSLVEEYGFHPKWRHIANSAGAYKVHDEIFTMLRVGLASYGINPLTGKDKHGQTITLTPALEFSSTLVQVKTVPKGEFVGYNCTHQTSRETILGLLPAGYNEGVDRRLSDKGYVKIRDKFFPIIGRVSMNMTAIDITELKNPQVGEKVVIYSADPADKNSIANAAQTAGTIAYDLLVRLAPSVKRIIV